MEFRLALLIVVDAPIAADRPFHQALPGLVERLDQVHLPPLLLGRRNDIAQEARLVDRRGERPFAHSSGTRPADFADPDLLAGEVRLHSVPDLAHMGEGVLRAHRIVLPIGEDVDGDEVGCRGKFWRLEPKFPDIGISHGESRASLDLGEIGPDGRGSELAPEQRLIADDESLDRTGIAAGQLQRRFDLPAIVGAVPTEPNALQHLEALGLGKPRNPSLRPLGRIGPDARGEGRESPQILGDLLVGNAEIPRKGRLVVMERCVGDAR